MPPISIPVFNLENLTATSGTPDIYFNDHQFNSAGLILNKPYRSNYYGIGLCLAGRATLKANLETYTVENNCLITISPQVIKQWEEMTKEYKTVAIFFTSQFLIKTDTHPSLLNNFSFFEVNAQPVVEIQKKQIKTLLPLFFEVQKRLNSLHPYRIEILRNLVSILLYEIASIYNSMAVSNNNKQTRGEQLSSAFKKEVCLHFRKERSVSFYAKRLFVSPKHLTETVKLVTGRSAKEWIDELLILEAKVLLQDPSLTIAQIADALSFPDQSAFGKFFKNLTGYSPLKYRQQP